MWMIAARMCGCRCDCDGEESSAYVVKPKTGYVAVPSSLERTRCAFEFLIFLLGQPASFLSPYGLPVEKAH